MDLIASALAFICAWSQPHCQALQAVPIVQQQIRGFYVPTASGSLVESTIVPAMTLRANRRAVRILIAPELDDAPYIGAVLAHEASEIMRGEPPTGRDCGDYEGFDGEASFVQWFSDTFGPPHPALSTMDYSVWAQAQPHGHVIPAC